MKRALITGISGQDGSYLTEYLLGLGYEVYGMVRREPGALRHLESVRNRIEFLSGDMRDGASLAVAFQKAWPDEIYNLAGQVFVPSSWEIPVETFDINVGGLARLLRLVESQKPDARVYQASSSEMFGNADGPCSETTPLNPTSPYGISKVAAHHLCRVYRERGLFVVGGILFNHESPRRGPEMVTRKITRAAAAWAHGGKTKLKLGNLQARRDWGFAGDYVRAMHAMLQQDTPRDYAVGTGESHSVADFLAQVLAELTGAGSPEAVTNLFNDYVDIDSRLLRTGEIQDLRADPGLIHTELGWKPAVEFAELVRMMLRADIEALK